MTQTSPRSSQSKKPRHKKNKPYLYQAADNYEQESNIEHNENAAIEDIDTTKLSSLVETSIEHIDTIKTARALNYDAVKPKHEEAIPEQPYDSDDTLPALKIVTTAKNTQKLHADTSTLVDDITIHENDTIDKQDTQQFPQQHSLNTNNTANSTTIDSLDRQKLHLPSVETTSLTQFQPEQQPAHLETASTPEVVPLASPQHKTPAVVLSRGGALVMILLLCISVLHTLSIGQDGFVGAHGWAYVLGGPSSNSDPNLLNNISKHLKATPGTTTKTRLTPAQYINLIVNGMSLDQKLGQMMIVQFVGPAYSLELSTMVSQYHVGAVLIFAANQNIHDKAQLKGLIRQMQANSTLPMAIAIDQEGGYVDRLATLDGPRPSEAKIGASGDTSKATAAGMQDAQDLASYGINLNLAPVVDVTNVYNAQLDTRTYGNNPALVTKMAAAYLQGLQKSGKVLGTLKHFPGLGDVAVDPHIGVPRLTRSLADLNSIDWAPYRMLIQQGNVHSIMVTHELVTAVDPTTPSSLSRKVVTGILRQQLGFKGVIVTDSLTMEGILAYTSESQAAAMAIEAGADLLMGASTASDVASMINGIKSAISSGTITQQQIDDSVRRILTMKYDMGLLPLP